MDDLSKDDLDKLKEYITTRNEEKVRESISDLHPADIAELLEELDLEIEEQDFLLSLVDEDTAADAVMEMDEDDRKDFLENKPKVEIATQILEHLDTDDAVDLIKELDEKDRQEVLSHINDAEQVESINALLKYDDDTAGSLMRTEMIVVNENWSMMQCMEETRKQAEEVGEIYNVYVVDNEKHLTGIVPLKRIIIHSNAPQIKIIMETETRAVPATTHIDDVAVDFEKYDLVAMPVIDDDGHLLGIITVDDVMDSVREQSERDYQRASGLSNDVETDDSFLTQIMARLPWLLLCTIGGIISSAILNLNEDIHDYFLFIPLLCGLAGTVGIQSSAIVTQGLSNGTLEMEDAGRWIWRELGVACTFAVVIAMIIFGYGYFFLDKGVSPFVVPASILTVVPVASLLATVFPLALRRSEKDPAIATGPCITIINEVIAMTIFTLFTVIF